MLGRFSKDKILCKRILSEAVKLIKNQIKNPLSDKSPVMLLRFSRFGMVDDEFVIEDQAGQRLVLEKTGK
jgi:hypothetical protein